MIDAAPASNPKATRQMLTLIEEFRKLNKDMSAAQMALFLNIALKPGLGVNEYAALADVERGGPITRNLGALSAVRREKNKVTGLVEETPGHNLIAVSPDRQDARLKRVTLTPNGQRILSSLVQTLGG